jgi:hypothetical protein
MCEVDFQRARQLQCSFSSLLVEVVWSRTFESLFRAHDDDVASARTFDKRHGTATGSDVNNVDRISLYIADPTNTNQRAIECADARWNSTYQPIPADYLTCSDPTLSFKVTSWTDNATFSLIINQTFSQGDFSETVLASYDATPSELNGRACYASGCNAYYIGVRSHPSHITFRQTTNTISYRAHKGMRPCTTSRRTVHPRPPSLASVHQLLSLTTPTGQSGTALKAQKIPRTRLPSS